MRIGQYLPSAQFVFIVSSVVVSGGLVLAAEYVTNPKESAVHVTSTSPLQNGLDWKTTLNQIQSAKGFDGLPAVSNTEALTTLIADAESSNITTTIGRTLLLNLSDAKSQGLGSDIPTQEKLIAEAAARLSIDTSPTYSAQDLTLTSNSSADLHTYGNTFAAILLKHPHANVYQTYIAVGSAVDSGDAKELASLVSIAADYKAIMRELVVLPVPSTLSPLHVLIINNLARIVDTYTDMQTTLTDPLRGLAGIQAYQSLTDETSRLFTNLAQAFSKNGILFKKDEPGDAWSVFLPQ